VKVLAPALLAFYLAAVIFAVAAKAGGDASRVWRGFECIHRYEGAWNANTGNGYYGGLQMDWGFMRTYGPEFLRAYGTADRWPPAIQVTVAMRAYLSGRGFGPWPNTARMCGLV
jgi:hypothetical protein